MAPEEGSTEHVPGGRDIWFFVLFESLVFTSYFCVYLFNRTQHEQHSCANSPIYCCGSACWKRSSYSPVPGQWPTASGTRVPVATAPRSALQSLPQD